MFDAEKNHIYILGITLYIFFLFPERFDFQLTFGSSTLALEAIL